MAQGRPKIILIFIWMRISRLSMENSCSLRVENCLEAESGEDASEADSGGAMEGAKKGATRKKGADKGSKQGAENGARK